MELVLNYIVESSVSLGIFALVYRLMIKKAQVLWFNRLYILASIIFTAVLPFLHFRLPETGGANLLPIVIAGGNYTLLEAITIFGESTTRLAGRPVINFSWIKAIYLIGFLLLVVRFILSLQGLYHFGRKARFEKMSEYILVDTNAQHSPFSFFGLLFVNRSNYGEDELDTIIKHELTHIQLKHSADILLVELVLIIQWFNPFIWLFRNDLKEVHEFQADRKALQSGISPARYKQLLLCEALGSRFAMVNNLNQTLIKKRLKMMNYKIKNTPGLIKPVVMAFVMVFLTIAFACENKESKIFTQVEQMPEFPGGMEALMRYVQNNLVYPQEAADEQAGGKVVVSFVVNNEGFVTEAKIEKGVSEVLDNEALRVVNLMPKWSPGKNRGKTVNVQFTLPIMFSPPEETNPEETFVIVENMPKYPGGFEAFQRFVKENVTYPAEAKDNGHTGTSYIQFCVNPEGKVTKVEVAKSSGNPLLDAEAIRVIRMSPLWEPGTQQGEKVTVKFNLPVHFFLDNQKGTIVIKDVSVQNEQMSIKAEFAKNSENVTIVRGKVFDLSGKPLEGVAVVIEGTTAGTITTSNGSFELKTGNSGEYLVFSHIGKETAKLKIER
ncbi:MAG: TonB family protein [Bacteroidales bacterium]|nr:TonB family protein [Bacteroidales bacterium]